MARNRKKKRGPERGAITLGGIKKVEKAVRRKMKNRMRKKLGDMNVPEGRRGVKRAGPLAPVRSVLFVDNTAGGELARRLQDAEVEMGKSTGYRIKIAESAGTPMGMLLPSSTPWGPADCEKQECVPCSQAEDKRIDCRKRNILYENRCVLCNPEGQKDGKFLKDGKGIYVGESSRSLYERAREERVGGKYSEGA